MSEDADAPLVPWIDKADRQLKALQLRRDNLDYREIAVRLGVNVSTAFSDVKSAIRESMRETVDDVRELELARLDRIARQAQDAIDACEPDKRAPLLSTLKSVSESRRKLLGLDAPTQVTLTPVEITVNGVDMSGI